MNQLNDVKYFILNSYLDETSESSRTPLIKGNLN